MSEAWKALCKEWKKFNRRIILTGKDPTVSLDPPEIKGEPTWVAVQGFYVAWCHKNDPNKYKEVLATIQKLRVASRTPCKSWIEEFNNLRQRFPSVSINLPQMSHNSGSSNLVPQTGGPQKSLTTHHRKEHANKTSGSISPPGKTKISSTPTPQSSRKTKKPSIAANPSPQRRTKKISIATRPLPQPSQETKESSIPTTPVSPPPQETKESSIPTTPVSPPPSRQKSQGWVSPIRASQVQTKSIDPLLPNAPIQRSKSTRICPIIQTPTADRVAKHVFVPSPRSISEASSEMECDWEWESLEEQELVEPLPAIYEILNEQWDRGRSMNLASEIRSVMKGPFSVIEDLKGFACDLEKCTGSIEAFKDRFIAIAWKHRNFGSFA